MDDLPVHPGSYALIVELPQVVDLTVGRLGRFSFPAGMYVYLGSAHGPGGLRARLGRHLRGDGRPRWHVDVLRAVAQVRGYELSVGKSSLVPPLECRWSQCLAAVPGSAIIAPGFGAGDCRWNCAAHLIYLPVEPWRQDWKRLLRPILFGRGG